MATPFPHLFQPIRIGSKQSRNRVMRLATSTNSGKAGLATEVTTAIYRRLARGGTGLIVSESMRVHPSNLGRNSNALLMYRKEVIPSIAQLANAAHEEGSLFVIQLNHGGRQFHGAQAPNIWAPSAIACPHSGAIPHQMTKSEIRELVQGFAKAARNAQEAGCDGIEVHGAQGHLIQEFVSAFSNQRDDEYGGSLENRLRFSREIISAVREATNPEFIVGYRMGVEEFTPGGITIEESKEAAAFFVKHCPPDYLSLAQGNFNTIDMHCPDGHFPPMTYVDIQSEIKKTAGGIPIAASARIQTPEQAEAAIAAGKTDMVGMCRALIADPEWPQKAMENRIDDIRRCIFTSYCWGGGGSHRLRCELNPTVGNELELPPITKVKKPKKVVIVGGGPAGLEAAHTAFDHGHKVVLFEKGKKLGGKLNFAHHYLAFHESSYALDFQLAQVGKRAIDVRLETPGTREAVLREKPDTIIVATGADIYAPEVPGDGSVPVTIYSAPPPGSTVVVMDEDGYYWAMCITEQLARKGCKVYYVTRFHEPLRELVEVSRISALRTWDELGVNLRTHMHVDRVEGGAVVLRHYLNRKREERIADAAAVVWTGAQRAQDRLANELRESGFANVKLVGDAYMPRRIANAISEGHRAARAV